MAVAHFFKRRYRVTLDAWRMLGGGFPSKTLTRSLATTNAIESLMSSVRRASRNVKRWRAGDMITRWVALGVFSAEQRFRRIKGHRDMPSLVQALRPQSQQEVEHAVA